MYGDRRARLRAVSRRCAFRVGAALTPCAAGYANLSGAQANVHIFNGSPALHPVWLAAGLDVVGARSCCARVAASLRGILRSMRLPMPFSLTPMSPPFARRRPSLLTPESPPAKAAAEGIQPSIHDQLNGRAII
eukprot:364174-Chlamydomonas_euryale.AAC.2